VPADDFVEPIVAFADDGTYDPSLENPLGVLVSQDLEGRVVAARTRDGEINPSSEAMAAETLVSQANQGKWKQLEGLGDQDAKQTDGFEKQSTETGQPSISDVRVAPLIQSK